MPAPERGPRERLISSAAQLIRRDGVGATGMRDVAEHAKAPRGSLQHYFPGGKEQLVNEAVAFAGRYTARKVVYHLAALGEQERTPSGLLAALMRQWTEELNATDFTLGCTLAAVTVDCAESSASTRKAAAAAFAEWLTPVRSALEELGVPAPRASRLATLVISSLEGALLMARAERSLRAFDEVCAELGPLLDAAVAP
ncbi:TetR/AcrR family transcriptional regulator [Streptacidiphilus rugosus]|uniref:TetR/AcrR family transcriptional regulator n=1 Tax=Streptacidiphilus rugosus TaxID=405783 RepID=UPI00056B36B7|nr:TetR/AcrR family transcriptional regulator [Streptacidiphilus rugosus]